MPAAQKAAGHGAGNSTGSKDQDALRAFAEELKAWRAARGWTQAELGAAISYSESMIAQVEACYKPPVMQMAEALDRVFATPGYVQAGPGKDDSPGTFMRLATRIRKMSFPIAFRPFTDAEEEATALFVFEPALFPGLFQTEPYARAVLATHPNVTEEQVTERLAARISRQRILARPKPPRIWLLLYQPVLTNPVGSPQTMYDQILKVADAARKPNVTVQVLPTGLHAALKGSFHIAENVGVASAAYMEDVMDGHMTQNPETLSELSERFRYLQIEAMTPSASRDFMKKVAKETWSET